ncbi:RING-type E3 ubiquitin transferase [Abeliophyllum distichum]|uniref:RING-type E3 ubiquitin transferase n=1 Tax=Abeliophyllum distichum TaxID=126358 RepID=A0ABD1PT46_9LAMI
MNLAISHPIVPLILLAASAILGGYWHNLGIIMGGYWHNLGIGFWLTSWWWKLGGYWDNFLSHPLVLAVAIPRARRKAPEPPGIGISIELSNLLDIFPSKELNLKENVEELWNLIKKQCLEKASGLDSKDETLQVLVLKMLDDMSPHHQQAAEVGSGCEFSGRFPLSYFA